MRADAAEPPVARRMPAPAHRSVRTAYLLLTVLGPFGAHKFYLGQPVAGFAYACTFGLFSLGTLYDLFTLPRQVRRANASGGSTPKRRPPPAEPPSALADPEAVVARYLDRLRAEAAAAPAPAPAPAARGNGSRAFGRRRQAA